VPGDAGALHDLAEDDVVDLAGVKPGPLDGLGDHRLGELDRGRLGQAPLEGRADGGAVGGDDDGFWHGLLPWDAGGRASGAALSGESVILCKCFTSVEKR
jgi:hypothetical protein